MGRVGVKKPADSPRGRKFAFEIVICSPIYIGDLRDSSRSATPLIPPATFPWTTTITEAIFSVEKFCLCDR